VDGAIVIEANARLREVVFPALARVGRYLHLHDNGALERLELPKLEAVGGAVSILDCPRLAAVVVASGARPATATALEVARSGKQAFPALFVKAT
jgi:hypothetical protein